MPVGGRTRKQNLWLLESQDNQNRAKKPKPKSQSQSAEKSKPNQTPDTREIKIEQSNSPSMCVFGDQRAVAEEFRAAVTERGCRRAIAATKTIGFKNKKGDLVVALSGHENGRDNTCYIIIIIKIKYFKL